MTSAAEHAGHVRLVRSMLNVVQHVCSTWETQKKAKNSVQNDVHSHVRCFSSEASLPSIASLRSRMCFHSLERWRRERDRTGTNIVPARLLRLAA